MCRPLRLGADCPVTGRVDRRTERVVNVRMGPSAFEGIAGQGTVHLSGAPRGQAMPLTHVTRVSINPLCCPVPKVAPIRWRPFYLLLLLQIAD